MKINCKGRLLDLSTPKVMGILNATPDSFFDGGQFNSVNAAVSKVAKMLDEGADMIDLGGFSSRPGADFVSEVDEIARLRPILSAIMREFPNLIVSVDTFRSEVARVAVEEYGAAIINDISSGNLDVDMFSTVAKLGVPYVMMHMQGTPQTMQANPVYANMLKEIFGFFTSRVEKLRELGVNDIILDPGFGFGKTLSQNYQLLRRMKEFEVFELPILVGVSRKSMIYKLLDTNPEDALNGTSVVNTLALNNGANILRVHDVKQAVEAVKIFNAYSEE